VGAAVANMATITTTPIQMHGYMISSSDINDDEKEDSTPHNNPTANPRGDLERGEGHNLTNDGAPSRPVHNGGADIYDTAYEGGRLRSDSPRTLTSSPSSHDLDELEREAIALRDEALQINTEAQAHLALELAKPWHSDFPERCISADNDGLHALLAERNRVEGDLNDMTSDQAADGTPLSPDRDYASIFILGITKQPHATLTAD
jgi:hypothetical protein